MSEDYRPGLREVLYEMGKDVGKVVSPRIMKRGLESSLRVGKDIGSNLGYGTLTGLLGPNLILGAFAIPDDLTPAEKEEIRRNTPEFTKLGHASYGVGLVAGILTNIGVYGYLADSHSPKYLAIPVATNVLSLTCVALNNWYEKAKKKVVEREGERK